MNRITRPDEQCGFSYRAQHLHHSRDERHGQSSALLLHTLQSVFQSNIFRYHSLIWLINLLLYKVKPLLWAGHLLHAGDMSLPSRSLCFGKRQTSILRIHGGRDFHLVCLSKEHRAWLQQGFSQYLSNDQMSQLTVHKEEEMSWDHSRITKSARLQGTGEVTSGP